MTTGKQPKQVRIILGAGGAAALVMVVLGIVFSRFIAAALAVASLGLLANHILLWLSGSVPLSLGWIIIFSTLLGIAGLGAGFIWVAVRNPRA